MNCRTCGAGLSSSNLDRRLAIITCDHCGAIFDLTRRTGSTKTKKTGAKTEPVEVEVALPRGRAPVAMPARFQAERSDTRMLIRHRWFRPTDLFLLFFACVWDGFLVLWYWTLVSGEVSGEAAVTMGVFPLIHVAVGVGVTYRAIAGLVNTTTLEASPGMLRVGHRPLPWWPAPRIPATDLEQLYVTRKVHRGKNSTTVTYELRAVTREHRARLLLRGLNEIEQALWLEQELESYLGIRDRRVGGEVDGSGVHH